MNSCRSDSISPYAAGLRQLQCFRGSALITNAATAEAMLQARMMHLGLGVRLWQRIGDGATHSSSSLHYPGGLHSLLLTFSMKVLDLLRRRVLILTK